MLNQSCGRVDIIVVDRAALDAPELGLEVVAALRRLYPQDYKLDRLIELLGNDEVFAAVARGDEPRPIADGWREGLASFERLRQK